MVTESALTTDLQKKTMVFSNFDIRSNNLCIVFKFYQHTNAGMADIHFTYLNKESKSSTTDCARRNFY